MKTVLRNIIFLLAFLAPLYVVRWKYFGFLPTTLLEFMIWLLLITWSIWRFTRKDFSVPTSTAGKPVFLILLASVVSLLVTPDKMAGLGIAKAYIWEPLAVFYILSDIQKQIDIKGALLKGLLGAGLWISLMGIAQATTGAFVITAHQATRAHGVFNNGNALALFVGPLFAFLFADLFSVNQKFPRVFSIFSAGIFASALILSGSTGGFIASVITVMFVLIAGNKGSIIPIQKITKVILVGSFLISIGLLFFSPKLAPQTDNPWVRLHGTSGVRLCLYEGTAQLIKDRPIFGTGLSGFKEVYANSYVTCDAEPLEYPHNLWMSIWVELGLLGLVGFFWLLYKIVADKNFSVVFVFSFIYILIHGVVDVPYFKNDLALLFWILLFLGIVNSDEI